VRRPRSLAAAMTAVAAGAALAAGTLGWAPAAGAAHGTGQVYVVHGIAGAVLDVYVDDSEACETAMTKMVVGPITLSAGTHRVTLKKGKTTVAQASFLVTAGSSTDLVAHRFSDASRAPTVTAFSNDLSAVPPGKARLLIAHTAAVQPADVLVNGAVLVRNVANGESSTSVVPGGAYQVEIVPTATTGPAVLGPETLTIRSGTLTNVFAIGDPVAGTMDAVVQQLTLPMVGAAMPGQVNTGDGGQAAGLFSAQQTAGSGSPSGPFGVAALLAALLLALTLTRTLTRTLTLTRGFSRGRRRPVRQ
jgi:Domain of unknown function (DUF4397)